MFNELKFEGRTESRLLFSENLIIHNPRIYFWSHPDRDLLLPFHSWDPQPIPVGRLRFLNPWTRTLLYLSPRSIVLLPLSRGGLVLSRSCCLTTTLFISHITFCHKSAYSKSFFTIIFANYLNRAKKSAGNTRFQTRRQWNMLTKFFFSIRSKTILDRAFLRR